MLHSLTSSRAPAPVCNALVGHRKLQRMMLSTAEPQNDVYANKGYQVLLANVILSVLATVAVALRIYARISRSVALGKDDCLAIIALVSNKFAFHSRMTF